MRLKITCISPTGLHEMYEIDKTQLTLGSNVNSDIDLTIRNDTFIAPAHARLYYDLGTWWIQDLGSENGVVMNGTKIAEAATLNPGSRFIIGKTQVHLDYQTGAYDSFEASAGIIEFDRVIEDKYPADNITESERLDILSDLQQLATKSSGQALLDLIVRHLEKMFPICDGVSIVLHKDKELIPVAFSQPDQSYVSFTLARRAFIQKRAFIWERALASTKSQLVPSLRNIVSALYAPIIQNRRTRGVIQLDTTSLSKSFSEKDISLLSEVANVLGQFIHVAAQDSVRKLPSIFISYSHKDIEFVRQIATDLRRRPISVWFDDRLRIGHEWETQLEYAISATDAFVLILSPDSVDSPYVQSEINSAKTLQKPFYTILYRECDIPDALSKIQYLDVRNDYDSSLAELADELFQITEK